jgi:uncharacterized protein (TIGR03437 family)
VKISALAALLFCAACALANDYTTYIGDAFPYNVAALTTDPAGNTYIAGSRAITAGTNDIFVSKLDPVGNLLMTATLSGKGNDQASSVALDPSGNIWIAGWTSSANFPLHNPLQSTFAPSQTGFLAKFDPSGTLLFSTYLGGTKASSTLYGIAVDSHGDVYVTGTTSASDYPRTPGLPAHTASVGLGAVSVAWFAKISAAGDKILYAGGLAGDTHACGAGSSCFLSQIFTSGAAIAVDASGNAYIAGNTNGGGLAGTPGALLATGIGAFVAKVNASGTSLGYLTFLGATNHVLAPFANPANTLNAIAADASGSVYLVGFTSDPSFPVTPGVVQPAFSISQSQLNPPPDAFAAKLNSTGTAMVWASYLGGAASDKAQALAVDPTGNLWIAGTTASTDFPKASGVPQGSDFLVEFNATGTSLPFAARFPAASTSTAIALDSAGSVHTAGSAGLVSTITPSATLAPRLFGVANAAGDVLAGRVAPGEVIALYGLHLTTAAAAAADFNSSGFLPTSFGGVQVTIGGIPAPLLYVSDTQINAVAPLAIPSATAVQLQLTSNDAPLSNFRLRVDASAPQVFRNPDGSAAAVNQDGSINSAAHPAKAGSTVAIWATGTGAFSGVDGLKIAAASQAICSCAIGGGTDYWNVTYEGTAPGLVTGITQINFQIPAQLNAATVDYFSLSVGLLSSEQTFVYIAP